MARGGCTFLSIVVAERKVQSDLGHVVMITGLLGIAQDGEYGVDDLYLLNDSDLGKKKKKKKKKKKGGGGARVACVRGTILSHRAGGNRSDRTAYKTA